MSQSLSTKKIPIKYQRYSAFLFPTIKHLNLRLDYARKLHAKVSQQKRSANPFTALPHLLRKQKLLTNLSLNLDWKRNYITSRDFHQFSYLTKPMQNLKSLTLTFSSYGSGLMSTKLLSLYESFFSHLKSLEKLELDFSATEIYQDDIFYICQGIKSLNKLQVLKINTSLCLGITDKAIKSLKDQLGRSRRLTHLQLNLASSPSFSKRSFHALCHTSLPKLQILDLNIIRNSDPYSLFANSKLLVSTIYLRKLSLGISRARLDYIARVLSNHADSLDTLRLKATHVEVNDEGLSVDKKTRENPFLFLKKLSKLRVLELDFSHSKMLPSLTTYLFEALKQLNDLESLDLNLLICRGIEDRNAKIINEALGSLNKLKDFSLVIGANSAEDKQNINDKFLMMLHEGMSRLQNLSRFSFECWYSDNVTDNIIGMFEQTLSKHENLTDLHIGFPHCRKITDKGLKPLCQVLKPKKNLSRLSLNFEDCTKLTCNTFLSIADIITTRPTIKSLLLNFSKTQVEDGGIQAILDSIKHLQEIVVNVERCSNIKRVMLGKNIKQLPNLYKAEFNFSFCGECSQKDMKDLAKNIEMKAPNLIEFNMMR